MMKMKSKLFVILSLLMGFWFGQANSAPQREIKIDNILMETVDLTREVSVGDTQTVRLLKVCLDGQAYFLFGSKPPSVAMSSFTPAFKDGKPETCTK